MIDYRELEKTVNETRAMIVSLGLTLRDCRNELCEKCGRYKEAHIGACKNCRWRDE